MLADVLNLSPPSLDTSDEQIQHLENPEPMHNHLDDHDYEQPVVERLQAFSTPANSEKERKKKYHSSVLEERERLRSELRKVKRVLQAAKQKTKGNWIGKRKKRKWSVKRAKWKKLKESLTKEKKKWPAFSVGMRIATCYQAKRTQ